MFRRRVNPADRVLIAIFFVLVSLSSISGLHAETLDLTEVRVIKLALENNLGVKIAESDRDIGKTGVQGAKSVFDTRLDFNVDHLIDKSATSITVFGFDNRTTNFNLGLSKILPSGTRAQVEWRNQRNSTDSVFAELNPYYESILAFSIEQPLLNNVFGKQDRGAVSVARKIYESADALSQRRILEATFQVLNDYWHWITNRSLVGVTRRSVTEARKFENISKQKEEFGLHESTDVLASKANRLQMENLLLDAKLERDNSLGRLRRGLNLRENIKVVSNERVPYSRHVPDLDRALTVALENRSDYLATKTSLERRNIELSLAKNRRWPELDLLASLEINGVSGGFSNAVSEAGSADNPRFFVGGQFSFPIENRKARSDTSRAELEKAKALYELKDMENRLTQDVEEQWREVQSWVKQVARNRRIERLQHDKWQEELKKYRTGRSSSDIVVRFQEDYLNAQRITINSLFRYRRAVLALRLAQNTLLP